MLCSVGYLRTDLGELACTEFGRANSSNVLVLPSAQTVNPVLRTPTVCSPSNLILKCMTSFSHATAPSESRSSGATTKQIRNLFQHWVRKVYDFVSLWSEV